MILHWQIRTESDWWFSKICGSGLDRIQFYRIRTGLGLKNFTVYSSLVAISSYTMAAWQHGSKHAEVWWQCPLSPWEQNQNKWPSFRVDVTVCDGDYEERPQFTNYCSCRTQALSANMFNWKKNRTSATHVKIRKYGICMEYGRLGSIPSVMCPSHFCRVRVTSPSSQSSEILSSQSRVMTWSSQSRVTRMIESLRVIGLQARVYVESYKFQTFPIYFWL